jgi:hypothetical protein
MWDAGGVQMTGEGYVRERERREELRDGKREGGLAQVGLSVEGGPVGGLGEGETERERGV